nr:MAG TPA: hypothetical protein [Ackermannviridae sp.]
MPCYKAFLFEYLLRSSTDLNLKLNSKLIFKN